MVKIAEVQEYVSAALAEVADLEKAGPMQAYMKTEMPFYGVQKAGRTKILRRLVRTHVPETREDYDAIVRGMWVLPHREEKYLAIAVARHFSEFVVPESLPLYTDLIIEGAWWDFVDEVATKLVRSLILNHPDDVWPAVDDWINNDDLWLRRSAIICQIGLKEATDQDRLFRFCELGIGEKEFFIRKAIGWALREYAKTEAGAVAKFVNAHADEMSGLSYREASKHIKDLVRPR